MITIEIDETTDEGRELLIEIKRRHAAVRNIYTEKKDVPEGYMTAEEWRTRCKKNISEIFRKYEHDTL